MLPERWLMIRWQSDGGVGGFERPGNKSRLTSDVLACCLQNKPKTHSGLFAFKLLNLTLLRSNGNITGIQAFIGVCISDALTRDVSTVHLDQNKTEQEYHR